MGCELTDNSGQYLSKMKDALKRAAEAVAIEGVGCVVSQMESGYGKPIRQTGTLMGDVSKDVEVSDTQATITVGNSKEYAPFVHFGTYKMPARPYLRDGIENNSSRLIEVAQAYISEVFE